MKTMPRFIASCTLPAAVLGSALCAQSFPTPPATWDTGLWVSYARTIKLTASRPVRWRVQLNVRHVLGDRDLEPVTGLDDVTGKGVTIRWRVPEPRTFILSNTLEF